MFNIGPFFGNSRNDTERFSLVVWTPSPAILIIFRALRVASKELVYTISKRISSSSTRIWWGFKKEKEAKKKRIGWMKVQVKNLHLPIQKKNAI